MSSVTASSGEDSVQVFESTSDLPYDRHYYEVVDKRGKRYWFDNYAMTRNFWFRWRNEGFLSHIEVLDAPKKKGTAKGF